MMSDPNFMTVTLPLFAEDTLLEQAAVTSDFDGNRFVVRTSRGFLAGRGGESV